MKTSLLILIRKDSFKSTSEQIRRATRLGMSYFANQLKPQMGDIEARYLILPFGTERQHWFDEDDMPIETLVIDTSQWSLLIEKATQSGLTLQTETEDTRLEEADIILVGPHWQEKLQPILE